MQDAIRKGTMVEIGGVKTRYTCICAHTVTHSTHDVHMYVWYTTNCMHVHVCLVLYSMYVSHSRV